MLEGKGQHLLRLSYRASGTQPARSVSPVLTATAICRRLGKSRRQVYRYLRTGRLRPCGRVLGQWLFAEHAVDRFAHGTLPTHLRHFFWDTQLSALSAEQHRDFILARLLEHGDRQALNWVFRTYSKEVLVTFLKGRGAEVLSRQAWSFWSAQPGLSTKALAGRSWRRRGRSWGGLP